MVENNLTRALIAKIEAALDGTRLPTKGGEYRKPQVINGFLAPDQKDNESRPFVIVRPESGNIAMDETTTVVSIIIAGYAQDMDGYEDCLSVFARIRDALTTMPSQTLDKRFVLDFPIAWRMDDKQPWPQWQVDMTTRWRTLTPEIRPERKEETYGYFDFKKG